MEKTPSNTCLWTTSYGISSNKQLSLFFPNTVIKKIAPFVKPNTFRSKNKTKNIVIGWGNKPNTQKAIDFSIKTNLPYLRLEDGFISYLGHPSYDKNRLSLINDDLGIYYDARKPSRLENLCLNKDHSYSAGDELRTSHIISTITSNGISKYNQARSDLPLWLKELSNDCILLVDQTAGDQSIASGLASADSFQQMLDQALIDHPDKTIIIKTHPDVLVTGDKAKKGHFNQDDLPSNVHLLTEDCLIPSLMSKVSDVYVVTSQLGFEALLYGKRVHCFGLPFYAGWGLTEDSITCERRSNSLTLEQLVFYSLVKYPLYLNPENNQLCEVEEVLDWLILQLEDQGTTPAIIDICYALDFSLWKRAFVKQFVGRLAKKVVFVSSEKKLESILSGHENSSLHSDSHYSQTHAVLLWGRGRSAWAKQLRAKTNVWFMEDGFLRSVGLGADLRRPSSLVIDRKGMYYDSSDHSDIIDILNTVKLSSISNERAESLAFEIKRLAITKYNVGSLQSNSDLSIQLRQQANGRDIIIVPGQFENDLSIACSLGNIKTNIGLLSQVRSDYPSSFIIFKEHPDVYSGVRPGALGEQAASQFADLYLADINMDSLLLCTDRVCTLTSLTGFEALLRNKKVTVYGSPFYAGWGLTADKLNLPNRHKSLSLNELIYGSMIKYSRYVDWNTGFLTTPEQTVAFLAKQREGQSTDVLQSGWLSRQIRKLKYFIDSYFF